jgi:hypothetical protein
MSHLYFRVPNFESLNRVIFEKKFRVEKYEKYHPNSGFYTPCKCPKSIPRIDTHRVILEKSF